MLRQVFIRAAVVTTALGALSAPVAAQPAFTLAGREVQIHGSLQQGAVKSDGNNYLTMSSNEGSASMTDGAVNVSSQITKKLRVGAQFYFRNIGQLGEFHPQLDWAYADFKANDHVGVRGGKVKTALGLYNDTQDMEFLYTWALLPQAVYPLDLRSVTISHVGADVYGGFDLKRGGTINYTVYGGKIPDDSNGGYLYGVQDNGNDFLTSLDQTVFGGDVRWSGHGLTAGYSLLRSTAKVDVRTTQIFPFPFNVRADVKPWTRRALYAEYQGAKLRLAAEYRTENRFQGYTAIQPLPPPLDAMFAQAGAPLDFSAAGWFVSGSYRLNDHLELGSYFDRYVPDTKQNAVGPKNLMEETVVTARIDLTSWWNLKVEGHFVGGFGDTTYPHGFYRRVNQTFTNSTDMLVIRTGFNF